MRKTKGFTLVEIVIVIAIIGVLAAVTIVALKPQEIFANGRNSRRVQDVSAINTAIGQWLAREGLSETDPYDALGLQTATPGTYYEIDTSDATGGVDANGTSLSEVVSAGYLQSVPVDPDGSSPYQMGTDDDANPSHILVCTDGVENTSTYPTGTGEQYAGGVHCLSN